MSARPEPTVTLASHPPERRKRHGSVTLPAGCCCCCCCCLHTVGGIIGGVIGSVNTIEAAPLRMDPDSPFPFRRDEFEDEGPIVSASVLYWGLVTFTVLVTCGGFLLASLLGGSISGEAGIVGMFVAFMTLPGLQLIASLLTLLCILLFYPSRSLPLQRLGNITLYSFAGAFIGSLAMAAILGLLMLVAR